MKPVHISLTDNPSHLAVNPVVLGQVRAKQFFTMIKREKVIPVLMLEMQHSPVKVLSQSALQCLVFLVIILRHYSHNRK